MKNGGQATPNYFLRRVRQERGWSQQEVAERIGAPQAFLVTRWERGTAFPSPHYRQKLCELFGKDAAALGLLPKETAQETSVRPIALYDPAIPLSMVANNTLVGRDELLAQLKRQVCTGEQIAQVALSGIPGVGKTAIAAALANDAAVQESFQDGILWAGLGPEPNGTGLLSRWGKLLGINEGEMSSLRTRDDWMMTVRTLIGRRRMLLIIDDAWTLEHALLFKLGGPYCAYLLTTRSPEIATRFAGTHAFPIPELSVDDGMLLLAQLAPTIVQTEPEEARGLVEAVGGLPLALTLIGNYLSVEARHQQKRRIRAALTRLQQAEARLAIEQPQVEVERHPGLAAGRQLSLAAVIGVSAHTLDESVQQALQSLSIFPPKPNTFSEEAALAIATPSAEALDLLVDTGLVEISGPDRYTLHQTIADYARVRLKASSDTRVYQNMIEYTISFVQAHADDYDVLEPESANVLAALQLAYEQQAHAWLIQGVKAFLRFLLARGMYEQVEDQLARAYQAALVLEDATQQCDLLLHRGRIARKRGNYTQAEQSLQGGFELADQRADRRQMSALLYERGLVAQESGNYPQAERYIQESIALARQLEDHMLIDQCLFGLGVIARKLGHYAAAQSYFQEGIDLARHYHDYESLCWLLDGMGGILDEQNDYAQAAVYQTEALAVARKIADRDRICQCLASLGSNAGQQSNFAQAVSYLQESLVLARQIGLPVRMCNILMNLGATVAMQKDYERADVHFREGLELAHHIGNREYTGLFLLNRAALMNRRENFEQCEIYLEEALALAREIGHTWLIYTILADQGEVFLKLQRFDKALATYQELLEHAPTENLEWQATAQYGLAQIAEMQGNRNDALRLGQRCLQTYEAIGHFDTEQVRQWLASLT